MSKKYNTLTEFFPAAAARATKLTASGADGSHSNSAADVNIHMSTSAQPTTPSLPSYVTEASEMLSLPKKPRTSADSKPKPASSAQPSVIRRDKEKRSSHAPKQEKNSTKTSKKKSQPDFEQQLAMALEMVQKLQEKAQQNKQLQSKEKKQVPVASKSASSIDASSAAGSSSESDDASESHVSAEEEEDEEEEESDDFSFAEETVGHLVAAKPERSSSRVITLTDKDDVVDDSDSDSSFAQSAESESASSDDDSDDSEGKSESDASSIDGDKKRKRTSSAKKGLALAKIPPLSRAELMPATDAELGAMTERLTNARPKRDRKHFYALHVQFPRPADIEYETREHVADIMDIEAPVSAPAKKKTLRNPKKAPEPVNEPAEHVDSDAMDIDEPLPVRKQSTTKPKQAFESVPTNELPLDTISSTMQRMNLAPSETTRKTENAFLNAMLTVFAAVPSVLAGHSVTSRGAKVDAPQRLGVKLVGRPGANKELAEALHLLHNKTGLKSATH